MRIASIDTSRASRNSSTRQRMSKPAWRPDSPSGDPSLGPVRADSRDWAPTAPATPPHRRATRDVDPAALRDLLEHPPRATVTFVHDGAADVVPARIRFEGEHCRFAVCADTTPPLADREIVLVVD